MFHVFTCHGSFRYRVCQHELFQPLIDRPARGDRVELVKDLRELVLFAVKHGILPSK